MEAKPMEAVYIFLTLFFLFSFFYTLIALGRIWYYAAWSNDLQQKQLKVLMDIRWYLEEADKRMSPPPIKSTLSTQTPVNWHKVTT